MPLGDVLFNLATSAQTLQGQVTQCFGRRSAAFGNDVNVHVACLRGQCGMGDAVLRHHAREVEVRDAGVTHDLFQIGLEEAVGFPFHDDGNITKRSGNAGMRFHAFRIRLENRCIGRIDVLHADDQPSLTLGMLNRLDGAFAGFLSILQHEPSARKIFILNVDDN
jgi:hypothetical protein